MDCPLLRKGWSAFIDYYLVDCVTGVTKEVLCLYLRCRYVLETFLNAAKPTIQRFKPSIGRSMAALTEAFNDPDVLSAVKTELHLPHNFTVPRLSSEVLYGDLSEDIHAPPGSEVFISSSSSMKIVAFFETLVSVLLAHQEFTINIYDETLSQLLPEQPQRHIFLR